MNMQCRWYGEDDPVSLGRKYAKNGASTLLIDEMSSFMKMVILKSQRTFRQQEALIWGQL
ncbi:MULTISPECIES: hypothetical protein [unclassified Bacillus (in: firmicutes)]|uniref:hypothetical protein n=1 Tax=unclassified Bacillus (in: firmicutes) TaxID=185979 RepID=UPI001CB8B1F8|nr:MULTISPECIES: hypothetical protein [unclassified Bacillus (in: firmicutes)]